MGCLALTLALTLLGWQVAEALRRQGEDRARIAELEEAGIATAQRLLIIRVRLRLVLRAPGVARGNPDRWWPW